MDCTLLNGQAACEDYVAVLRHQTELSTRYLVITSVMVERAKQRLEGLVNSLEGKLAPEIRAICISINADLPVLHIY